MLSWSLPRRGAVALLVTALAFSGAPAALAADAEAGEEEESGPPPDGAIEIPYGEPGEIRPGVGWLIDCDRVGQLAGVTLTCSPESIALEFGPYDPDWGEHPLPVALRSAHAVLDVTYTVRLAPPPAPEFGTDRFDVPIPVGTQAMIPLAALGITCAVCTADGGALIELGTLPAGVKAGVDGEYISVRGSRAHDAVLPLRVTDDAGQQVTAELTVSFVDAAPPGRGLGALHMRSSASEWDLNALSWGDDRRLLCAPPVPAGLVCSPDGIAKSSDDGIVPGQFMFRVVDENGAQTWGSVTVDDDAGAHEPAAPSWADEAPLRVVFPPADDENSAPGASLLETLLPLLKGVPAS